MGFPLFHVDAFTPVPFAGNPAGVCLMTEPRDEAWMQGVAREMNLSETAFLLPEGDGYRLRWFTPAVEVALCGHATLASAHVLWEHGRLDPGAAARFHTRSGVLGAARRGEWIEMDFPARPGRPAPPPASLARALGIPVEGAVRNGDDWLVPAASETAVRTLAPDIALLRQVEARGIIVTARSDDSRYDFVSRFFAPRVGVDEDPVTGSAHCCLAPYWAELLHRAEMTAFQASRRGGVVRVRLEGDRVMLAGQAVTVSTGALSL